MRPTKMLAIAMSLLLVSSNMAMAKVSKQKLTRKVATSTSASAKQTSSASQQLMKKIKKELKEKKKFNTASGIGLATAGLGQAGLAIVAMIAGDAPDAFLCAASALGTLIVGGSASLLEAEIMDASRYYPDIRGALNRSFLDQFTVILTDPDNLTKTTRKALVDFLINPEKPYDCKALGNGDYRFFFVPYSHQYWVDINIKHQIILVRSSSFAPAGQKITGYAIAGIHAPTL